jgi:hypothetical protein
MAFGDEAQPEAAGAGKGSLANKSVPFEPIPAYHALHVPLA